jgi:hypothetical protein
MVGNFTLDCYGSHAMSRGDARDVTWVGSNSTQQIEIIFSSQTVIFLAQGRKARCFVV